MSAAPCLLAGRSALIVGLDEIGAGIARRFVREGARVALLSIDDERQVTLTGGDVVEGCVTSESGIPAADPERVSSAVRMMTDKFASPLDVLVCNLLPAAAPHLLEHLDSSALDVALKRVCSTVAAMRAALAALRASGRGRIVIVGHRYGESVGETLGAYNVAAWSLVGLARTAALEWGQYQIATNVLLPLAQTAEFEAAKARRPKVIDLLVSQLPLRRVGDPVEDIGGAAAFLASDAACFVNGQVVCADGGQQVAGPVLNPARFA
jgi:NAD(P)-dependent dehydrogenase (short-subunit alcohol dehydrogenase family)